MMLMHAVVGSMIFIKHRLIMELFSSSWRNLWKEWELRGMILISLSTQIFLILLGNNRRRSSGILLTITVWSAYLLADSIATMASSILSNILGDVYKGGDLDPNNELKAFWAPFFLLHLGGTDTITAYSLEDNELWRRHLFGLVSQAVTIFYIMLLAWTSSHLSFLFIVMFLVGLVKYLERVWVLYSASDKKFRDSISDNPMEGRHLTNHQVANASSNQSDPGADEIVMAYNFREMVKRLFADLILGINERKASRDIFEHKDMGSDKAFKIIEIELGFIYDLLYTKAKVVYSYMGIGRRIIGFFSILIVFVTLTLYEIYDRDKQHRYRSEIDLIITMVVLAFALLLELCAFAQLLLSDHATHWLIKRKMSTILGAMKLWAPKKKEHRWSNSIAQLSLLHLSLNKRHLPCRTILKKLGIDEILEIELAMTTRSLSGDMNGIKENIFTNIKNVMHWAEENDNSTEFDNLFGHPDLEWSIRLEFDQRILIWHLATDILYHNEYDEEPREDEVHARGIYLSRYMLYLLVKHPYMLPIGMAHIRFQDIYVELKDFIEEEMSKPVNESSHLKEVAAQMIKVNTTDMLSVRGDGKISFVIFHACKLSKALNDMENKWEIMFNVWMEMLCHAASLCKGRHHAQLLRQGGEFFTHVWLLMAHFGLTNHFQIPVSTADANPC
ncbi:hypothetical protein ACB092_11G000900 [Castanea dentata]